MQMPQVRGTTWEKRKSIVCGGRSSRGGRGPRPGGQSQPAPCLAHCLNTYVPVPARDRFLAYVPFSAIAMTITAAAKIELYTYLACEVHKPVVTPDRDVLSFFSHNNGTLTLDRKS